MVEGKPASRRKADRGTWVAQSFKHLTLAQVMTSWLMSSIPMSGSVLTAQSLEPALDSVSPSLDLPFLCSSFLSLSLFFSKINIKGEKQMR